MTLIQKEIRETAPLILPFAAFLLLTGWLLDPALYPAFSPLIQPFIIVRFIIGISFAATLGAVVFAGDRQHGMDGFLYSLPLSVDRIFFVKTLAGLIGTSVILLATSFPDPASVTIHWWPVIILAFTVGQFFGVEFDSVNASALSSAIGLAAYCAFNGTKTFDQHYFLTVSGIFLAAALLAWAHGGLRDNGD